MRLEPADRLAVERATVNVLLLGRERIAGLGDGGVDEQLPGEPAFFGRVVLLDDDGRDVTARGVTSDRDAIGIDA